MEAESVTLNPTEQSLVRLALRERDRAVQAADRALDEALAPVRAAYGVTGVMQLVQGTAGYSVIVPVREPELTPA